MIRLLVVGDPVDHSLSPAIQNAALRHFGLEGSYGTERMSAEDLPQLVRRIQSGQLTGANVTMPLKVAVVPLCDSLMPEAHGAGAVNTLLQRDDRVIGANTDVAGIRDAWQACGLPDDPALIVGAGGAAAAALVALNGRPLSVTARSAEAVEELLERTATDATRVPWGEHVSGAVLVNATPLGMEGEMLPSQLLEEATGLLDMSYSDSPTPATAWGRERGIPVADGTDMLVYQAIRAFELWTGLRPPPDVLRVAVHS